MICLSAISPRPSEDIPDYRASPNPHLVEEGKPFVSCVCVNAGLRASKYFLPFRLFLPMHILKFTHGLLQPGEFSRPGEGSTAGLWRMCWKNHFVAVLQVTMATVHKWNYEGESVVCVCVFCVGTIDLSVTPWLRKTLISLMEWN